MTRYTAWELAVAMATLVGIYAVLGVDPTLWQAIGSGAILGASYGLMELIHDTKLARNIDRLRKEREQR